MATIELARPAVGNEQPAIETRAWSLTMEHAAYLLLGVLSFLVHVWGLGDRALHHDETLHAAYSWYVYSGRGYIHDPLLHGPFLYYIGALFYFLFGDNDFTARLGPALFGTALTLMPFLVRREIGRGAALVAAVYLLISPVFLYMGRFIRHDIYSITFEFLVFAAVVRYASTRKTRWLYVGVAAFALMFVNQETSYLFLLIIGTPLILLFLWRLHRPGVLIVALLGVALAALIFVLPGEAQVDGAHNAVRDPQTGAMQYEPGPVFGWAPLETYDNAYALRIRNRADNDGGRSLVQNLGAYLGDLGLFFRHPAVLISMGLMVGLAGALVWFIWLQRDREGRNAWGRAVERGDPIVATFASLAADRRWVGALVIFGTIYVLFFTAFFTNLLGTVTGTTGSLLYWLAQHNVERGGQPWYYYVMQLVLYEPLVVLWAGVGFVLAAAAFMRRRRPPQGVVDEATNAERVVPPIAPDFSLFALAMLVWWSMAAFALYTWAGEKMPWLTVHIGLPLVLLGAWAFERVVGGLSRRAAAILGDPDDGRLALPVFGGVFAAVVSLFYVMMTAYVGAGKPVAVPIWAIPVFTIGLLLLLTIGAGLRWGWNRSLLLLALCVSVAGGLYTMRNAYRLAYINGDVPRETMIYTQTSPDVMRVVRRVEEAALRRGGMLDMPILYDNETVWTWYLRDFTEGTRVEPQLSGPPDADVQAVFMLQENLDRYPQNREYLRDFRIQRFPLRWWIPEDPTYRLRDDWRTAPIADVSLLGEVLRTPLAYETQTRIWDYLVYRDPGVALGSSDFVIAVRPELANQIGPGLGGSLAGEASQ